MACRCYREDYDTRYDELEYFLMQKASEPDKEHQEAQLLTKAALISVGVFLACVIVGGGLERLYEKNMEQSLKRRLIAHEAGKEEHILGEEFSMQKLVLCVEEVRILTGADIEYLEEGEMRLPEGKKLVAVRIAGRGDILQSNGSKLWDAYARCGDVCYCQLTDFILDHYEEELGDPALTNYTFMHSHNVAGARGWIAFVLDEDVQDFNLCLEERSGTALEQLETIHTIAVHL